MQSQSTNNNSNQSLFLSELKELRDELSTMKKRIVQLGKSHEKQQERLDTLERENHTMKTELLNINGNKAVGSVIMKRKRTEKDQFQHTEEEKMESKPASVSVSASAGRKKTKTNNNNDDDEIAANSQCDNGDSFDSLSDDLLHKIVEFNGNCYVEFGLINKRCRNIYDVEEYKLEKKSYVFGYGTIDMILVHFLQRRKHDLECIDLRFSVAKAVVWYERLDLIDWIIQTGDNELLHWVCSSAASWGRIDLLTKLFCKTNLKTLDDFLDRGLLCYEAADNGQLETLKWLRSRGAKLDAVIFNRARDEGYDEIVQYLRAEGCPETYEDT